MDPVFLTLDELLAIHLDQVDRYGGSRGIRDLGLLKSAAAMPASTFGDQFLHQDLAAMAAAYLFHIVSNHPFVDGNKRVGAVAAVVFLELNDVQLDTPEDEFESLVMGVAEGESDKDDVAEFFRRHIKG